MRAVIGLVAVTLMGCPFDEEDGDPNNYVVITEIAKTYKRAYCTYALRCGLFPDAAVCEGASLGTTATTFGVDVNEIAGVYAGRVIYNGSNVKRCLDAFAAQSCDRSDRDGRVLGILVECRDILRGTLDAGEACTIDAECVSQVCSGGDTGTECVMGTCVGSTAPSYEPAQLGQPCSPTCAEGLFCDLTNDICRPLLAGGQLCQGSTDCAYGLLCITESATTQRVCKVAPALNEPCPDFVCRDDGQYCDSTTMTCKQVGLPPAQCTSSTQCSQYYPCDFTLQQCKRGPSIGMMCSTSTPCFDEGAFCDFASGFCAAAKADGNLCNADIECISRNCDPTSQPPVCTTPMSCL